MTLTGKTILITGATGQLTFPIVEALAPANDVIAAARFSHPKSRARIEATGATALTLDILEPDWSAFPERVDHVLHMAAEIVTDDYDLALRTNAEGTALIMHRFATADSILVVSTGAVYDIHPDPAHLFAENDPLGDSKPMYGRTYPLSKMAQEATARGCARALSVPTTIARMNLSYGSNGGLPAYQLDMMRRGEPIPVATHETRHSLIHQDDVVASIPRLLDVASVPATLTNWGGNDAVPMRDYCEYMAGLIGHDVEFIEVPDSQRSRGVDVTRQHELIGPAAIGWQEGIRRLIEERPDRSSRAVRE